MDWTWRWGTKFMCEYRINLATFQVTIEFSARTFALVFWNIWCMPRIRPNTNRKPFVLSYQLKVGSGHRLASILHKHFRYHRLGETNFQRYGAEMFFLLLHFLLAADVAEVYLYIFLWKSDLESDLLKLSCIWIAWTRSFIRINRGRQTPPYAVCDLSQSFLAVTSETVFPSTAFQVSFKHLLLKTL